jgi:hypothetical protein
VLAAEGVTTMPMLFIARANYIDSSSAEFVRERYAVQAIPTEETNGCSGN